MDRSMDELQENLKRDSYVVELACEAIRQASLKERQMAEYNENLRATFDSEVQKTAMQILESTATGMNDGGGSLKYTSN